MPLWTIFVWLVIGGVAGYVASKIMGRPSRYGLVGDIVVGLLGSVIGGWLVGLVTGGTVGGLIGSIIVAIIGAIILLYALRALAPST